MSWAQQRLKLKQTPIDSWSLKEQLTLALAVLRTGDQNWVSVSRTMKQFNEPGRPMDWYSQKNCALQYNLIIENRDIPKRKRGEKIDAKDDPGEQIARILGHKRMEQLREVIQKEKEEISKLEKEVELLSSGNVSEEDLEKIILEIQNEDEEEEKKRDAHAQFIKQREDKKLAIQAALKTGIFRGNHPEAASSRSPSKHDFEKIDSPVVIDAKDSGEESGSEVTISKEASSKIDLMKDIIEIDDDIKTEPITEEVVTTEPVVESKENFIEEIPIVNKKNEPDVVDLEPPVESVSQVKIEDHSEIEEEAAKIDQDDDEMNDAEEIAGNLSEEIPEQDLKEELKEDIKLENMVEAEPKEEVKEIKTEIAPEEEKTFEPPLQTPMEIVSLIKDETIKEEKVEEDTATAADDHIINEKSDVSDVTSNSSILPLPINIQENEIETKKPAVTTPRSSHRRGRPRSKKNSEVVADVASSGGDDLESSGTLTGALSTPSSTRPTSPSPETHPSESPSTSTPTEPPNTPKLLEQTSLRLKARRSSRQGLVRALKDSAPISGPLSPLSTEEEKEYKAWKKGVLLVWSQIAAHKHANIFAGPVSEGEAPDYKNVVMEPMDLGTIKKNIEAGVIRNTEEFQRDLALMFFNASMYNSTDHPVHTLTLAMHKDTEKMIKEFLNTQALMKANEAPKLRTKEVVKVMTSRTRTGSGSQTDDKKK